MCDSRHCCSSSALRVRQHRGNGSATYGNNSGYFRSVSHPVSGVPAQSQYHCSNISRTWPWPSSNDGNSVTAAVSLWAVFSRLSSRVRHVYAANMIHSRIWRRSTTPTVQIRRRYNFLAPSHLKVTCTTRDTLPSTCNYFNNNEEVAYAYV